MNLYESIKNNHSRIQKKHLIKESHKRNLKESANYVYTNAESDDKSDADSRAEIYRGEAPNLRFKVRKDTGDSLWHVDFIGKSEDIENYLKKLGWYTDEEIKNNKLISPMRESAKGKKIPIHNEVSNEEIIAMFRQMVKDNPNNEKAKEFLKKYDPEYKEEVKESCKGKRGKKKLKETELPEFCYSVLPSDETKVIAIKRNEEGYFPVDIDFPTKEDAKAFIDKENKILGVDEATRNAMEMGSMFGWHVPGANPDTWRKEKPANKLEEADNSNIEDLKDTFFDLLDTYEEAEDIIDALRSMETDREISKEDYDLVMDKWEDWLQEWEKATQQDIKESYCGNKKRFKKKLKESEIPSGPLGKVLQAVEDAGWGIEEEKDGNGKVNGYAFETWSPAGEDLWFNVACGTEGEKDEKERAQILVDGIVDYANIFDADEHAAEWVETRGQNGAPDSIQELLDDALAINEMYRSLADAVESVNLNESCKGKKKHSLKEGRWSGNIKSGAQLRKKLQELDEDASPEQCREVLDILKTCCEEAKALTDDEYYQNGFQSVIDDIECIYYDEELNSGNVDWELDGFYDWCDGAGLWVNLNESCKGRKGKKKLRESVYALEPEYGGRNSYYGKALVEVNNDGRTLYSYGTPIARIKDGNFELLCDEWALTNTTLRHLREFMQQEGLQPIVRKDLVKMISARPERVNESAKGSIVAKRLKESAGSLELPKEVTDELESDQHNIYQASVNEMALSSYGSYDEIEEFFKGAPACQAFARECNEKGIPFEECRKALHDKAQQVVVWAGTNIADGQDDEYINSISQNK